MIPRMYVVATFDFCGSSDVRLHAVTADEAEARAAYADLAARPEYVDRGPEHGHRLVEVPAGLRVLASNNRDAAELS